MYISDKYDKYDGSLVMLGSVWELCMCVHACIPVCVIQRSKYKALCKNEMLEITSNK